MTNFLPAGIINESIVEISRKATELKQLLHEQDMDALRKSMDDLEEITLELGVLISKFSCEPLIYTGQGSTEEIIKRLEWALAFSEEIEPLSYLKSKHKVRKRKMK